MRLSYQQSKELVLAATYDTLYSVAEYESFKSEDIHRGIDDVFSVGFTRRILRSLAEDGLVKIDAYDESSPEHYTLTDEGIAKAENIPSVRSLKARLTSMQMTDIDSSIAVPAADRMVSLSHNQIEQTERPINEIVSVLEQDNGDPDQPGLRERLLGEIKAGRELVRAGEFRAFLLYETLVRALGELIKRYKNPAIVALAEALLGVVVSQMMQG